MDFVIKKSVMQRNNRKHLIAKSKKHHRKKNATRNTESGHHQTRDERKSKIRVSQKNEKKFSKPCSAAEI